MDDYSRLVADYVTQAWDSGKTTAQIKAELAAKRWPEDMVSVIIDRLVKDRVEQQEGKLQDLGGPDLWSQPTWPVKESWGQTKTVAPQPAPAVTSEPISQTPPPTSPPATTLPAAAPSNTSTPSPETLILPSTPLPATTTELPPILPTEMSAPPLPATESPVPPQTPPAPKSTTTPPTPKHLLEWAKNQHQHDTKLEQKLQKQNHNPQKDALIQKKAFTILAILIAVIILALIWRIVVIK
ncbi:hypothetical protein IJI99_01130 [bacterium]|nr:hypothetical protein [bacterium]